MGNSGQGQGSLFFVHVMKTGGSTFRRRIVQRLGAEAVFPCRALDPPEAEPNLRIDHLASLPAARLEAIRAFTGHFPFFAATLVPRRTVTITILRDPVDRVISYLKQHHRQKGLGPDRSLESIYDLPWHRELHMLDYQVRVFATTAADGVHSVMEHVEIDERRMEVAKDHLREVDLLGLHECYDDFTERAMRTLGWPLEYVTPQRVSMPGEVPDSLRRKIAADNEADLEFYAFARELYKRRHS
ncbi:MAG: hypothetical protein ACOYXM_09190 [Actinomycetota bacterium]